MPDVKAIDFGSTLTHGNYLETGSTGPTGVANGKQLTFSGWLKPSQSAGRFLKINRPCLTGQNGAISIKFENTSGDLCFQFLSGANEIQYPASQWYHLMFSFDLTDSSKRHVYLNGVDIAPGGSFPYFEVDNVMKLAQKWIVGGSNNEWPGCLSEFWIDDSYMDLSIVANRKLFYRDGEAVYLGADGSLPTGSQPLCYLPLDASDPGNNLGSGSDMTVSSGGSLGTGCADAPSRFSVLELPRRMAGGVVEWIRDDWTGLVATDLDNKSDKWGDDPGRLRQGNWCNGAPYAVYSSAQNKDVARFVHTYTKWDSDLDPAKKKYEHSEFELNSEEHFTGGTPDRALISGEAYKISLIASFGSDWDVSNSQWAIFWQAKDISGQISNPIMTLSVEDLKVKCITRWHNGTSQQPDQLHSVDGTSHIPWRMDGDETFHLFEIEFKTSLSNDGYIKVDIDGVNQANATGLNIGSPDMFNGPKGILLPFGEYHYFWGSSSDASLQMDISDIRLEHL